MKKNKQLITSSMEDYLEVINDLEKKNGCARVTDIGACLNVKRPSVTEALAFLSKLGYVKHEKYGAIELTKQGQAVARSVREKHDIINAFLTDVLSVDEKTADADACKIEHALSEQTFERMAIIVSRLKKCGNAKKPKWLTGINKYLEGIRDK